MENAKVSVIVPIYNVEKFLPKCIESIINQEYENIEIILVDDGSPDNSREICEHYKKIDNRIVVIHKENAGVSEARNTGIDHAKGDYISLIALKVTTSRQNKIRAIIMRICPKMIPFVMKIRERKYKVKVTHK